MLANVLLLGGTAMIPGFAQRVVDELRAALASSPDHAPHVALVPVAFPRNMLAWVGASIFAATESARAVALTAQDYAAKGHCVPDWLSIAPASE